MAELKNRDGIMEIGKRKRQDILLDGLILALAVLTLGNLVRIFRSDVPIGIGENVEIEYLVAGEIVSPVDHGKGLCRYVVLADPHCGACRETAESWTAVLSDGSYGLPDDGRWKVFWIVFRGVEGMAKIGLDRGVVEAYSAANDGEAMRALGIPSLPWHLILDNEGRLVESAGGGRLPEIGSFGLDSDHLSAPVKPARSSE